MSQTRERIVEIADNLFQAGYFDIKVREILNKDKPSMDDEKELLDYIDKSQKIALSTPQGELSMREMKTRIFKLIGADYDSIGYDNYSYGTTVSKKDLKKIYNFIIALPNEYIGGLSEK